MRRKKLLKAAILLIVLVVAVLLVIRIFSGQNTPKKTQIFSNMQAKKAAQYNLVKSFETWRGPEIKESHTFYDLEGAPSAYLFNVVDNYGRAGYMIISATTKLDPVVTVSTSADSPITQAIKLTNEIVLGTFYEARDVKTEYLYLGGDEYYARLTFREGDELTEKYYLVDEEGGWEFDLESVKEKQDFYTTYQDEDAHSKWEAILSE